MITAGPVAVQVNGQRTVRLTRKTKKMQVGGSALVTQAQVAE